MFALPCRICVSICSLSIGELLTKDSCFRISPSASAPAVYEHTISVRTVYSIPHPLSGVHQTTMLTLLQVKLLLWQDSVRLQYYIPTVIATDAAESSQGTKDSGLLVEKTIETSPFMFFVLVRAIA